MKLDAEIARKKELEQKLLEIQREIQEIQTKQKKPVLASIVESMIEMDINPQEVVTLYQQRTGKSGRKLGPAPAKYRHPQTGQSWSGRGKAPRWLVEEEEHGTPRDKFLVEEMRT